MPEMLLPMLGNVLFILFLAAFKQFQLMNLKRSCVEGEGDSGREEKDHVVVLMSLPTHQRERNPGGGWGHLDINWEAEMSSFNTPCTDYKCFIPLTCLYAGFVLPSLINTLCKSFPWLCSLFWGRGYLEMGFRLCLPLSELCCNSWCDLRWHPVLLGTGQGKSWKGAVKSWPGTAKRPEGLLPSAALKHLQFNPKLPLPVPWTGESRTGWGDPGDFSELQHQSSSFLSWWGCPKPAAQPLSLFLGIPPCKQHQAQLPQTSQHKSQGNTPCMEKIRVFSSWCHRQKVSSSCCWF